MTLGEILAITSEHTVVRVIDCATGDTIARYDGRDSIDEALNDKEVVKQYVQVERVSQHLRVGQLCIEVK